MIGRTALAVLYALLFDCLDFKTGQLDPSYEYIAKKAGVCRRAVATALARLKDLGLLHWQRRSHPETDGNGGFRLVQETNAYASLPPSQWRGYFEPPPSPPPEPGTWGDHPPLPPVIDQAAADLAAGSSLAPCWPGWNAIRATRSPARSRLSVAPFSAHKPRNLRECKCCQETLTRIINLSGLRYAQTLAALPNGAA